MSSLKSGKFSKWDRVAEFLRRKHPVKTAEFVEEKTGIKADTVRKMLAGGTPSFDNTEKLINAYHPHLVALLYDRVPDEIAAAIRSEELRQARAELARSAERIRQLESR